MREYGTVISRFDSPSTHKFSFVIKKETVVRRGQFIQLTTEDGKLIGRVTDVYKANRYFMRPESVNEVEQTAPLSDAYPTWEWEYIVADVSPIGVSTPTGLVDANFPPSPGTRVFEPETGVLSTFFGVDPNGLNLGSLTYHDVTVKLNVTRLLQKHLAILAMSGAGKSHLTAVLIEELLARTTEQGKIAIIVIDPHGEYTAFADDPAFAGKTRVFPIDDIQIGLSNLHFGDFKSFAPDLSGPQARELTRFISDLKRGGEYGIGELIHAVESKETLKNQTKEILLSELLSLASLGLFGATDYPPLQELARPGGLSVIDLSAATSLRKKQIATAYLANKLFEYRRKGVIPPFVLIVEEAHNFCPEKSPSHQSISRSTLEKIAREGRKFHSSLCLISQRPIKLSTTILSQCNTHIILRITNPYDLKHIEESSEGISHDVARQISSLKVGTGMIVGEAVNFPVFLKIRSRTSKPGKSGLELEQAARDFTTKHEQKRADARAML